MNDILTDEKLAQINESSHQGSTFEFEASYDQTPQQPDQVFVRYDPEPKQKQEMVINYATTPFYVELSDLQYEEERTVSFYYTLAPTTANKYQIKGVNLKSSGLKILDVSILTSNPQLPKNQIVIKLAASRDSEELPKGQDEIAQLDFGVTLSDRTPPTATNPSQDKEQAPELVIDPTLIIRRPRTH
ncbi:hypothetical protein [Pseudoalteromonas luteoviolacea]|uniref:hypothetical protein n=1 Tax=Pseudoalteromonas luteoviolacea TaxID=43657 RepID=UPI001B37F339|nr:hypothetical protein [Pseudoalteromonas luteoviolacea]MBQ4835373.1 hypothetical protein [Pseudoalteromonas luteoviolacea]